MFFQNTSSPVFSLLVRLVSEPHAKQERGGANCSDDCKMTEQLAKKLVKNGKSHRWLLKFVILTGKMSQEGNVPMCFSHPGLLLRSKRIE